MTRNVMIAVGLVGLAVSGLGCKKNVDPAAFDAGATTAPVVAAATPSAPAADVDAAAAPLAALASASAAPTPSATAHKPAAKPKVDPAECVNARNFCSSPKVGSDPKVTKMCEGFKAECLAKGGKV